MTRIFTTDFSFNHQTYNAIITVTSKDGVMNFTVKVIDLDLYELLPEGLVKYEGRDGFKKVVGLDNALSQHLMQNIAQSIDMHLEAVAK